LFDEIKPRTLPKQERKRKEAPQSSTAEPAANGQIVTPDGPTATGLAPDGPTAPSSDQTARAQEAHGPTKDQVGPTAALES
jgi:hypothetical protein